MTPIQVAASLSGQPGRVLLHSGSDDDGCGRWSFAAARPAQTVEARGRRVIVRDAAGAVVTEADADPLAVLEELVAARDPGPGTAPHPIAIGYLGYDLGRTLERIPSRARADTTAPDLWFGLYDRVWRHDHATGRAEWLGGEPDRCHPALGAPPALGPLRSDWTDDDYARAFARVHDYLHAGDVYQVNLARRLRAPIQRDGDALALYARLHAAAPCPFGALLEAPGVRIASGSPELFLRRPAGSRRVETRPIKGTRVRTGDLLRDREAAADLLADDKERAEHLMIVDLERNDLGRVARLGTVRVDSFARVVELPTLYHMVSTVSCELRDGAGTAALLRATFPGGSITGAPKVRAMQIIEELEPTRRGVYTGAFGYLGAGGAVELAIAIRVVSLSDGYLHLHVGGGLVADSTVDRELAETEHKAAAWRAALAASGRPASPVDR